MNQRTVFSIAKEVTADLLGHREMHVRRASLPVVASSRVPVRLDGNLRGIDRESTPPPTYFPLRVFQSTAASAFVVVLPLTPHAFFAWRAIFVASGLSRCKFSLPLFRLLPFSFLFPLFVPRTLRAAFCRTGCRRRAFWEECCKPNALGVLVASQAVFISLREVLQCVSQ